MRRLTIILVIASVAFAASPLTQNTYPLITEKPMGEITDKPAWFWTIWWTGVGELQDCCISNTMQGGFWGRHPDDERPYDGMPAASSIENRKPGYQCEWPKGSEQFYVYASGFWFGALVPPEDVACVSKAAYYTDMGAMSVPEMDDGGSMGDLSHLGLYFSNMRIPYEYGYEGEGDKLFAWPGEVPETYQVLWPFADTSLNEKREPGTELDPSVGDVVSHEDTYAVGGDWIPVDSATVMWERPQTEPYDGGGLGIRIEQRTYSWDNGALADAIVFNYKIRNMNDYTLKAPYFGYFMDADVGDDPGGHNPGDPGAWDDLIGFDAGRDMGYTYDSDGEEPDWSSPAGYVGVVLIETPGDVGLTGFETWEHGNPIDDDGTDTIKYEYLTSTDFETSIDPDDVRMLLNSGTYPDMAPDDEYDYTLAIVVGETLAELQETADSVVAAFEAGLPWFDPLGIADDPSGYIEPARLELTSANITDGLVHLQYSVPSTTDIELAVFDASGRQVEVLAKGSASGLTTVTWDASTVSAGVYFISLNADGQHVSKRVTVLK